MKSMTKEELIAELNRVKLLDKPFSKYFKLYEDIDKAIFANVWAGTLTEEDFEYESRVFQVETVILDKVKNLIVLVADNDGIDYFMDNYPTCEVYEKEELEQEGAVTVDMMSNYYHGELFYWGDYLVNK